MRLLDTTTAFKIWEKHTDICEDEGLLAHMVLYFQFRTHMEHRERYFKLGHLIGPVCFKHLQILQWTCPTVKLCYLNGWRKLGLQARAQPGSAGKYQSSKQQNHWAAGLTAPCKVYKIKKKDQQQLCEFLRNRGNEFKLKYRPPFDGWPMSMLKPNLRHGILLHNWNTCKWRCAAPAAPAPPAASSPFLNPPIN